MSDHGLGKAQTVFGARVAVEAAARVFGLPKTREFCQVEVAVGLTVYQAQVEIAAHHDELAHMEPPRQFGDSHPQVSRSIGPQGFEQPRRGQELSRHRIACRFFAAHGACFGVGDAARAKPKVRQFMQQGEQPCSGRIGCVDEHHGSQGVADGKAAKLPYVEFAPGFVAHDAAAHDEDACPLGSLDECAMVVAPLCLPLLHGDTKHGANVRCHGLRGRVRLKLAHEWQWPRTLLLLVFDVPSLALQSLLDGFQQIDARFSYWRTTNCSEVRQQRFFHGRLLQEEKAKGCMERLGNVLRLAEGRKRITGLPARQLLRLDACRCGSFGYVQADAATRPAQHRGVDLGVGVRHGLILANLY